MNEPNPEMLKDWRDMTPYTFAQKVSEGEWKPYPHLVYLGRQIFNAAFHGNGRVIVNMPPAHGKTEFLGKYLPLWYLEMFPKNRIIYTTYANELSQRCGRWVRDYVALNPLSKNKLKGGSTSVTRWENQEGGGMMSVGIGGPITGFHANLLLVDDPIKGMNEAYSARERQKVITWFNTILYKRRLKNATIILLMTRWHNNDLAGWLLKHHPEKWQHIKLPALAEAGDPLGRAIGEPLCDDLIDLTSLEADRRADPAGFQAMDQQDPQTLGSGKAYHKYRETANLSPHVKLNRDKPLHWFLDFNVNPGMNLLFGQSDGETFITTHQIHGPRMLVEACVIGGQRLIEKLGGWQWPELHIFGDATSSKIRDPSASEAGYTMIKRMMQSWLPVVNGKPVRIRIRTPRANPPIVDSLLSVNDVLCDLDGKTRWLIHPRCTGLQTDLTDVDTDENGLIDKADEKISHPSDACRYWIHYLRPMRRQARIPKGRYGTVHNA